MADFGFEVNAVATGNERIQEYYMPPYIQGFYTNDGGTPRYDNRKKEFNFPTKGTDLFQLLSVQVYPKESFGYPITLRWLIGTNSQTDKCYISFVYWYIELTNGNTFKIMIDTRDFDFSEDHAEITYDLDKVTANHIQIVGKKVFEADGSITYGFWFVQWKEDKKGNITNFDTWEINYDTVKPHPRPYGKISTDSSSWGDYDDSSADITPPSYDHVIDDPSGGGGTITVKTLYPTISAVNIGMISMWKINIAQLKQLGEQLWSSNFFDTIVKSFQAPMDAIVSLNLVPAINKVYTRGSASIHLGNYDTGITAPKTESQFFQVDMGKYTFNEYWASALDYNPYTSIQLYLPYIGMVDLSPDDVMRKTIHVVYVCDALTGQVCVYVYVSTETGETVLYTYTGNLAINIPITGANYGEVYKAAIQGTTGLLAGIGASVATGGVGGAIGLGSTIASTTSDLVSGNKMQYQHASSMNMTAGYLGVQFCYVIITRPIQSLADDYNVFEGYPSNVTSRLKDLSGYTIVESVHLENMTATDEEKAEIESLLKAGVIL